MAAQVNPCAALSGRAALPPGYHRARISGHLQGMFQGACGICPTSGSEGSKLSLFFLTTVRLFIHAARCPPECDTVMHLICVAVLLCLSSHRPFFQKKPNFRLCTVLDLWDDSRWSSGSHRACKLCCCFLRFQVQRHFFLIKKSDGRLYTVLEQCAAVTAAGPVVCTLRCRCAGPCAADVQAWVQTQVLAILNFRSLTLCQNFQYAMDI